MTDKKLEKEAGNWLRQYLLCYNCEKKCNCIDSNSYCEEEVLKSYLAGAEPREKRIAELEWQLKEITEDNDYWQKENEELEKENAELKSIAEFQTSSNMDRYFQLKKSKEQLTKAKEIIRDLLSCLYSVEYDRVSDLEEAEQFLKEV